MMQMFRQWMLLPFLLIALPAFAQRDLTMNVKIRNASSLPLDVVLSHGLNKGRISCSPEPSTINWIPPAASVSIKCLATAPYGNRDVWLKFAANNRRVVIASAAMRVYGPNHEFKCYLGCTMHDHWSCGDTGPCRVAIEVVTDRFR